VSYLSFEILASLAIALTQIFYVSLFVKPKPTWKDCTFPCVQDFETVFIFDQIDAFHKVCSDKRWFHLREFFCS